MADVEKFTRKRGSLKGSLTLFVKFIEQKQANIERGQVLNDTEVIQIQERLSRIEIIYQEFSSTQDEIEASVALAQLNEQYTERASFEEIYFSIISIAKNILNKFIVKNEDAESTHSGHSIAHSSVASLARANFNLGGVKLPVIPLPKFHGLFYEWLEYKETFQSLVHENESLSAIQKYHYLRASLEGSAAQILKSIEFTSNGYTVAWETLNNRFNNSKLLIHNHIKALFTLENIQKESSVKIRKMIDDVSKHLRSLEQLNLVIKDWDPLLIYMVASKLDQSTASEWEKYSITLNTPALDNLKTFLTNRANFLETLEYKTNVKTTQDDRQGKRDNKQRFASRSLVTSNNSRLSCYYCKRDHSIYVCEFFLRLSVKERIEFINKARLCMNCLRRHPSKKCKMGTCKKCHSWHNTLLHEDNVEYISHVQNSDNKTDEVSQVEASLNSTACKGSKRITLLSTARVKVLDKFGNPYIARALLDSGSMSSFITESLCDTLGLDKYDTNLNVLGISNSITKIRSKCQIHLSSLYTDFTKRLTCFILPQITNVTPGFEIDLDSLKIPRTLHLADEEFNKPGSVDLLIGSDLFWLLLKTGRLAGGKYSLTLQETELGWVIAGPVGGIGTKEQRMDISCSLSANQDLRDLIARFWEVEELSQTRPLSNEEAECERIFSETTSRNHEGRFIVNLPLKQPAYCLGESRSQGIKMFYNLEKRLQKNESLRVQYINFMREYQSLNHMTVSDSNPSASEVDYFMPHHGVLRKDSLTTKLRVVFNASSPSSNGISLNNIQHIGPVLQDDLFSILLRFREGRYVVSADCKMMYRQVLVNPQQRKLQQILWRESPTEVLTAYTLNTVTYGQACASFLAIRCLFQLADECADSNPEIADIIKRSFYVDDLLFSTDSIKRARYICQEISRVLKSGCFELRKWYSNDPKVLDGIEMKDETCGILTFGPGETTKTLGLTWSCHSDKLSFCIDVNNYQTDTKRSVLSLTARIFDPLGMLSPCTILAKILMQRLWSEKVSWDEDLPADLAHQWRKFKNDLSFLNQLTIERHVVFTKAKVVELHGFSDASERAYGACVYVRSLNENTQVQVKLLCSKSKVSPIKTLSVPRLELCAALLLARLVNKVKSALTLKINECFYWSDSLIVLAWIKTSPNLLKTFVATRIAVIQSLTNQQDWRHVPTQENPADHLSRGLYPHQILDTDIWWHGPNFLKAPPAEWPTAPAKLNMVPELKPFSTTTMPAIKIDEFPFGRFSQFSRLIRVVSYILRFKNNCLKLTSDRDKGPLSIQELNIAKKYLIKVAQRHSFPDEFACLSEKRSINAQSKILNLTPFLDSDQIIRVGGRLDFSNFLPDKKHPIVLHSNHPFTKLLFAYEHIKLLHVGPQALLSSIRNEFWPVSGRNLARITVKRCIRCFRFKPSFVQPIMANLPRARTVPSPPFHITGLDYGGPFLVRQGLGKSRSCRLEKCYVAVFVCFSTKALHLELVSSLTTNSFLLALRRFISRRGKPSKIVSDNGTTFVGAHRELKVFLKSHQNDLKGTATNEGIDWQFICPYSPHMGGLWESGVKSVKHHLRRVLANAHLTFEEFTTTLSQIEAILNSRPLCPLSSEPNDLIPLTPAHFLIGRTLTAAPDENLEETNVNRLTRFQLVQRICQHFWRRWQQDYISELQQRQKWKVNQGQLLVGTLVLIKDDQALPTEWKLGRIIQLHPGGDGVCRIASILTSNGCIKRNFQKICPLPLEC